MNRKDAMLDILKVDHVGIRIRDRGRSVAFYGQLGFELVADAGFDDGHPVILRHPSGLVLNLLGPSTVDKDENILMDVDARYAGYTHIALQVSSLDQTEATLRELGIEITGGFEFKGMRAVFIRDPDRNVIELDHHGGARGESGDGYSAHP